MTEIVAVYVAGSITLGMTLGIIAGWISWGIEVIFLRKLLDAETSDGKALLRDVLEIQKEKDTEHRMERERILQQLVSLRRAGFQETSDDEIEDSWVLDNAHEAEVAAHRKAVQEEEDIRDDLRNSLE